ncbi:hypothetical protein E2562_011657 [Oryza meyeriana var. granulata]|uniref:CCT domain-containing protein n=1 Tax=Oryza meyeriana var. granulata TaxID=110450 RepID=A0A6G1DIW0_9ORYZ|nr:hypothetical protein E2562_011657 [Oryza meyeriana var. granulata]KAF0911652.1 hypothetical protein E2562_011657 [Oryza meyeriana var. granulata]KAF0911653.1 hypothetical protein E2562_011657 [Oryza meyeriana var. granulata]
MREMSDGFGMAIDHCILMMMREEAEGRRVPVCQLCGGRRALVFCPAHAAGLCFECDAALHHAGADDHYGLHPRAPICDSCHAAPAHLRSSISGSGSGSDVVMLCRRCAPQATSSSWPPVTTYTGCPSPKEMVRILSTEAPSAQPDFDAWLADHLLFHDDARPPPFDAGGGGRLTMDRRSSSSAAMPPHPTGLQQQVLFSAAPCSNINTTSNNNSNPNPNPNRQQIMPPPPPPPPAQHHLMISSNKKREERNRAKLRYNNKKMRRKFCTHIMYTCRKATADSRKRVKGRFARASSSSHHS